MKPVVPTIIFLVALVTALYIIYSQVKKNRVDRAEISEIKSGSLRIVNQSPKFIKIAYKKVAAYIKKIVVIRK